MTQPTPELQGVTTNNAGSITIPTPTSPGYVPPASQDELNRIVESRLAREREKFAGFDDLKAKAARLDAIEEQNKTELQKAQERVAAAEKAANEATTLAAKATVAATKGVPMDLLSGSNKAELEASADALLAFKGTGTTTAPPAPAPVKALAPGRTAVGSEKSVAAGAAMFADRKKPTTTP